MARTKEHSTIRAHPMLPMEIWLGVIFIAAMEAAHLRAKGKSRVAMSRRAIAGAMYESSSVALRELQSARKTAGPRYSVVPSN